MAKLRFNSFHFALMGHTAGPEQNKRDPLGVGGEGLHEWVVRLARQAGKPNDPFMQALAADAERIFLTLLRPRGVARRAKWKC